MSDAHVLPPSAKVLNLAERLICSFGTELSDEVDALSAIECQQLDMIAFECAVCNHWYHQRDNANPKASRWECKDCNDDA